MVEEQLLLREIIGEAWEELDRRFRTDSDALDKSLLSWLNILGVLQSRVDSFELGRSECGLPAEDADVLFLRYTRDN